MEDYHLTVTAPRLNQRLFFYRVQFTVQANQDSRYDRLLPHIEAFVESKIFSKLDTSLAPKPRYYVRLLLSADSLTLGLLTSLKTWLSPKG